MATTVRVKDNKTGVEREVNYKAYALIPKRYTALAFLDKDGNEVENPSLRPKIAVAVKKKAVEPAVVSDIKRPPGRPKMTDEERAAKKLEFARMNQEAIDKVLAEQKTAKA
jgi:hypothetical protein